MASNISSLTISKVHGIHASNHSNDDVKMLKISNSSFLKNISPKIGNFFQNLKILHIENSSLEEIHGNDFKKMQKLTCLCLLSTKLTSLPGNFFQFLSKVIATTIEGNEIDFVNGGFLNGDPEIVRHRSPVFQLSMKCYTVDKDKSMFVEMLSLFNKIVSHCTEKDKIFCTYETKTLYACKVSKYRQFDGVEKLLAIG